MPTKPCRAWGSTWNTEATLSRNSNLKLFERDRHLCAYCGASVDHERLTRDHFTLVSRGGKDIWTKVVVACGR